jgi:hypothetical protein
MTEDNTPITLKVIEGGRDNIPDTKKRSGKTLSGLTTKQEKFCEGLANGLSNADAYRAAYDSSNMKANVIYTEASKLATRPDINKRVEALIAEKHRRNSVFTDKQREKNSDRIWRKVWELIDNPETPPAVKANLLSLGAKAAGMLTDKVQIENTQSDSKAIEAELIERLQKLTG